MNKISVCTPVYEQFGYGVRYLSELLDSLMEQKGEFEVIISDNSRDGAIEKLCKGYNYLDLKYIRNNETFGVSNNTNNAINHASHELIKIMYSDDVLLTNDALQQFGEALGRKPWAVSYSRALNKDSALVSGVNKPRYNNRIITGLNTLGMPSIMAMRRNEFRFDNNLTTLLDCECYYWLYKYFGEPEYITKPLVGQRYWHGSMSLTEPNHAKVDYEYLKKKYKSANLVGA